MNWRRWVRPGLVATFVLAVVAVFLHSGVVEQDLAEKAQKRLADDGQSWARVELSGRSATVLGTAPSAEAQNAAVQSVGRVTGIRSVSDASALLPIASPYVWSLRKSGLSIALNGSVPSEGFRTALLAATRRAMPRAEIHDQMQLARGAPAAFNSGTAFVLDRLSGLAEATATISDSTLSVSGVATDPAAFAAAKAIFRENVPPQLAIGPIDILPARADPFVWSADYDGTTVTLSGYVPDEITESLLVSTAEEAFPGRPVADEMTIASGSPDGFADAAIFAIGTLPRFDRGGVTLDGMELDVTGTARTVDDYETVLEAFAGALPRGMQVVSSAVAPATVAAYFWRGEKEEGTVTLSGYVPSPGVKEQVVAAAQEAFAGDTLVDEMRIAAGEPQMDWIGAIKFAMSQLARLGSGFVALGGRTFAIEGEAASPEAFTELLAANAQTLPASLELRSADVVPPTVSPYRFVAARLPDALRLEGHVASEADRERIIEAARSSFGAVELEDNLVFASGAPEDFVEAATVTVHAVSRLAGGRSEIVDAAVNISGGAYYPKAAGALVDSVGDTMPDGFNVAMSIMVRQPGQPVPPLRCRDLLQKALTVGRIEFAGGKVDVSSDSYGVLDRVAAAVARCPEAIVEIGAHTDSDGSEAHNQELSQSRANAIVEFLVDAGVRRERLEAVGYGESKPIADNSTPEGKAANRRIEFVLAVPQDEPEEVPQNTAEDE